MERKQLMDYLSDLALHNNKEWFHDHKEEYQQAKAGFEELVGELMLEIGKFDPSILGYEPKELTFKLMRDTRFSKDKSPYNPTFRAHISSKGKLPVPVGYFVSIGPGNRSFLGGGIFAAVFKEATSMVRDHLVSHGEEFQEILERPEFKQHFRVEGEKLKNVPPGYPKEHPLAQYLKYKSWFIEYGLEDPFVLDHGFITSAAGLFQLMKPFNDFLNRALAGFVFPERR